MMQINSRAGGIWTPDFLVPNQARYPCATARNNEVGVKKRKTGATGLEPAISGVTGQRDNQLRYAPVMLNILSKH